MQARIKRPYHIPFNDERSQESGALGPTMRRGGKFIGMVIRPNFSASASEGPDRMDSLGKLTLAGSAETLDVSFTAEWRREAVPTAPV